VPHFLEVPLSDGEAVLVEVTGQADGLAPVGRTREVVGQLPEALSAGLHRVQKFAGEVLTRMRSYPQPPDRVAIEFGITFSAKTGVVIAESAGEAHLTITTEWSRDPISDRPMESEGGESDPHDAG
jgi:hypothetical protein